jgi:transcriptional regulator with XRE-family HTH domain
VRDAPAQDTKVVVQRLAENVRRLRHERNITQEELAARAGIHRTQTGAIETGRHEPRVSTLVRIARALDVELSELLDGVR